MAWALGGVNGWLAYSDARAQRLLRESAVPGEATVVRKFVAPDGRTHRIEYRVAGVEAAPLENVEVNPLLWSAMAEGERLPVLYVPADPSVSHLRIGQIDDVQMSSAVHYGLSAVIAGMGVVFFVGGLLELRKARAGAGAPCRRTDLLTHHRRSAALRAPAAAAGDPFHFDAVDRGEAVGSRTSCGDPSAATAPS